MAHDSGIRLLPPELQNQIAAGEVVERPASVLKELMENALDAGATRIRVQMRDGGQTSVVISDNGSGIPAGQLELAVTRHATSKLETLEDLQTIRTFGFRGEALPSIASVCRFHLASSSREDGVGAALEMLYGRLLSRAEVAMPRGTRIEISDLFANVPARLKFLKQPATETRKCTDIFVRMALANLQVDFELLIGDRQVHRFLAGQSLADRLTSIWPDRIMESVHDLHHSEGGLEICGLLGDPATAQARPDRILIYVNQRPVQDKTVLSAVREGYRGKILGREYPQAVIFLRLPLDEVDVNVHPAKSEVRFRDEGAVFRAVRRAVVQGLERTVPLSGDHSQPGQHVRYPDQAPEPAFPSPASRLMEQAPEHEFPWPRKFESSRSAERLFPGPPVTDRTASCSTPLPGPENAPPFRYLGQFANTYLIVLTNDEITLIDQHAAHERVLFHMLQSEGNKGDRRPLLMALEIPLHPAHCAVLQERWNELSRLGFSLELSSPQLLLIRAVPALLTPAAAKEFLEDVLISKARSMEDLWSIMACRAALKAGEAIAADEALSLIEAWQKLPDHEHCPHGRPIALRWGERELEKMFKRRT